MFAHQRVGPGTNRSLLLPCLILLIAGHSFAIIGQTARRDEKNMKRPVLPIRLLNLTTYGDSIAKWLEPGATNFAQINWRNANLNAYDFRKESKPKEFLEKVEVSRTSLRARAEQAKKFGLLVYLNEYELNFPDFIARETLGPASEREKFMEEKLYELFIACPWLEGYMITPTESKLGSANPTELKAVVMGAYKGMKRAEKQLGQKRYLFVRSWLSAASKLAAVRTYFPINTDPEIAKDIIVVAKEGLGDFVMRRPLNPLFGAVQPHSICAEFDVSVSEYRSLGWYPQGPADLWSYRMQQLALTPGVVGINIHTGRLNELPGITPEDLFPRFKEGRILYPFMGGVKWSPWHHLNIVTIFRLLRDPWEKPKKIYEDWARDEGAIKPVADILSMGGARLRQEPVSARHRRLLFEAGRHDAVLPLQLVLADPLLQQGHLQEGRARRRQSAEDLAGGLGRRQEDQDQRRRALRLHLDLADLDPHRELRRLEQPCSTAPTRTASPAPTSS